MFDIAPERQAAMENQPVSEQDVAQSNMMETEMSPDVAESNVTLRLKNIFGSVLRAETVIQVFGPYVAAATQSRETQAQMCVRKFHELYEGLPEFDPADASKLSPERAEVIKWLCEYIYSLSSPRYVTLIFYILTMMVKNGSFRSTQNQYSDLGLKELSEQLFESEELSIKRPHHWTAVFNLIGEIVEVVNYKAIQKILIIIVNKLPRIPANHTVNRKAIQAHARVMNRLLDREANLLPAYMSLNDIRRLHTQKDAPPPCWTLSQNISKLEASFRPLAAMITIQAKNSLLPMVRYNHSKIWRHSQKFWNFWYVHPEKFTWESIDNVKIPFHPSQYDQQYRLLNYVISHRYSYEMLLTIMSMSTERSNQPVKNQLGTFVIKYLMEIITSNSDNDAGRNVIWQHLQVPIIQMLFHKHINLGDILKGLRAELRKKGKVTREQIVRNRDSIMWLLLQYMSAGMVAMISEVNAQFMDLFNELYVDVLFNSLEIPELTSPDCVQRFAALCIFMHAQRAAHEKNEGSQIVQIPRCLVAQQEKLKEIESHLSVLDFNDYQLVILINVFSILASPFERVMACLTGDSVIEMPGSSPAAPVQAHSAIKPMSVDMLDRIKMQGKIEFSRKILNLLFQESRSQEIHPSPALVYTYTRFLVYTETERLIFRPLTGERMSANPTTNPLPSLNECIQSGSLTQLHITVEILRYRLHHVDIGSVHQAHSILLNCLNTMSNFQMVSSIRDLCFHLIQRIFTTNPHGRELWAIQLCDQPEQIVSDCEELNKCLIMAVANGSKVAMADQAGQSTQNYEDFLADILRRTPLILPFQTLRRLPDSMRIYLEQHQQSNMIPNLAQVVQNERLNFQNLMQNEAELIQRFVDPNATPVFLCIIWKLLEPMWNQHQRTNLPAAFYQILQQMEPKTFRNQLRTFTDFIVEEISRNQDEVHKYIQYLLHLIWDQHVIPFDQFIQVLVLRPCESPDTLIVAQLLMLNDKADGADNPFLQRVHFLKTFPIDHFNHEDYFRYHLNYHQQFPESFNFEILATKVQQPQEPTVKPLPVYFGNVCFRMLPVIDLFIHRYLEMELAEIETPQGCLDTILDSFVSLYRFHHQPLTFVYQTLYCFTQLPAAKKRLLAVKIIREFDAVRPAFWALSEKYLAIPEENFRPEANWEPDEDYWMHLLGRLVMRIDAIGPDREFDSLSLDWRYMEFTNSVNLTVFASCIEVMTLPCSIQKVTDSLIDLIVKPDSPIPVEDIPKWFNAFGMITAHLPYEYSKVVNQAIITALNSPEILQIQPSAVYPSHNFSFSPEEQRESDNYLARMITCVHACWSHMAIIQLTPLQKFLENEVRPILRTEMQLLFILHLISPFLSRLEKERTRILSEVVVELYQLIHQIGQQVELIHVDAIADLLYHIKYKYIGEYRPVMEKVREFIRHFPQKLRDRLKFMYTHRAGRIPNE